MEKQNFKKNFFSQKAKKKRVNDEKNNAANLDVIARHTIHGNLWIVDCAKLLRG